MLSVYDEIPRRDRVIVALDTDPFEAYALADRLQDEVTWVKIGMTLLYAEGPQIVKAFKDRGFKVFVDLKLHDIPHQVSGAAASLVDCGADMLTFHASGGVPMLKAGEQSLEDRAFCLGIPAPITLGVTVLTSMNQEILNTLGVVRPVEEQVLALAAQAQEAGLSGVVASPWEASKLREMLGEKAAIVTPGVRPVGVEKGDQSRVATPAEAFEWGASHIVVGRPITQADNPVIAFKQIASSLEI